MKLRRRATENGIAVIDPGGQSPPACPYCKSLLEPGDDFCPNCGAAAPQLRALDKPSGEPEQRPRRTPGWARAAGAAIAGVAIAAGVAVLVLVWLGERSDRIELQRNLVAAHVQIGNLEDEVATLKSDLAQAQNLAEARGKVLAQTDSALQRVDPLLSSVDGLTLVGGQIQEDRDAFQANASQLRGEMVDFSNYLIETSPFDYDFAYIDGEITYLNGRLDDFDAAAASLDDRDRAYADAAAQFDRRANAFSGAVRRLERALKDVSG